MFFFYYNNQLIIIGIMETNKVKPYNNTLVLDADGTFIPLFTDNGLVQILQENIQCVQDRTQWMVDILRSKFSDMIDLIHRDYVIRYKKMNTLEECFNIKVNSLINTGIISSASGAAFNEMLQIAYQLSSDQKLEIDRLMECIDRWKHTTEYDWFYTPEIYTLYLDSCSKLYKKILELLGWEKCAEILIKYALLDDIAYPERSLLEYCDVKLQSLNDNSIKNQAIWTTYIITKGIFDTYGTLENYKELRRIIKNQTTWKNIVIWTLSLYGEQLGMLLGIDISQSFDTLKLRNGTIVSQTTLTHQDEKNSGRFTVYNKKSENGLKRFYEVSQIEPNTGVLVDDTADNVRNFKLGYIVNKLQPSNAEKFNINCEYYNYLTAIINGEL